MTLFLKQSTAVVISFGSFLDKTDGVTEETGLVSALDHATTGIKLSKNGGALTIRHATVTATTYDAYGMYRVTLDTTDTNTVGTLRMAFNEAATCLPVWQDFMVLPANVYDSLVGGSDLLDVSMTQILGTAVSTPATAGILDVNVKNIDNDAASASGTVTFPNATLASTTNITAAAGCAVSSIGANVITAASIAADAITDAKVASDVTIASVTGAVGSVTGAVGSVTGNVGGNIVGSVASVTAGVTLAASAVQAIWDALTSALTTVGSIGKKLADWVIGTSQTGDSFARLGAPAGASVSADIAAVQAKTVNLPAAPASTTNITAATGIDITKILGTAISTPATAGVLDVNVKNIGGNAASISPTAGVLNTRLTDISVGAAVMYQSIQVGGIATDGITADSVKADAVTKIQAGLSTLDAAGVRTAVGLASANLDTQLGAIDDYLDTEVAAIYNRIGAPVGASISADIAGITATVNAADIRAAIGMASANLDTQLAALPTAAENAAATWSDDPEAYATGQAGNTLFTLGEQAPIDAAGVRAAVGLASANLDTQLAAIDDAVDTEVAAIYTRLGAPAGASVSADIAAVKAETALIQAKTTNLPAAPASTTNITAATGVTVSTNNDKTGYALSAGGVQAIWDALTSALTTVGSIGKLLVDRIDAAISSRSTYAGGDTSGVTTLLSRIVGTLAAGTHNPQTGDSYARIGAPAGASMSADIAAVKVDTAAVKVKTDNLPSATAGAAGGVFIAGSNAATTVNITGNVTGNLSGSVGSVTGAVGSVTGAVGSVTTVSDKTGYSLTATTGLGNQTANITGNLSGSVGSVTGAVGSVTGAVGSVAANGITSTSIATDAINAAAVKADAVTKIQTGLATPTNITAASGVALTSSERNAVSDALLDRADAIATGITTRQALEIAIAVLAGKLSGAATATITIRDVADTKNVVVATTDASGNRTAVTITP